MNYKKLWIILGCVAIAGAVAGTVATNMKSEDEMKNTPAKVYYVKEITPENLIKIYDAIRNLLHTMITGKRVFALL